MELARFAYQLRVHVVLMFLVSWEFGGRYFAQRSILCVNILRTQIYGLTSHTMVHS